MKKIHFLLLSIFLLILGYNLWSYSNRITSTDMLFPRYVIGEVEQIGINNGKGNILALSPYLKTYDFSSKEAFYNMFHYYFSFAKKRNLLNDSTIVVLPEYIGTWLVVANEKQSIYSDTSIEDGMKMLALSNLGKFGLSYIVSTSSEKTKEAIFKAKSKIMLDIYQSTFSKLAKEFRVTIVAGSIVLPNPIIKDNKIEINRIGKLYNISAVFDTNGIVISPLTKKIFPIDEEKCFTSAADKDNTPIYKLINGNLAVLICADAWYPENYAFLKDKNVSMLLVPSFISGNDAWNKKWKGYNGAPMPKDVTASDTNSITEHDAWLKYAMVGRILKTEINTGVNVFLRGDLWNLGSDGNTLVNTSKYIDSLKVPYIYEGNNKEDKTGTMVNVWL